MNDWFKARNTWGAAIEILSDAEAGRLMKALWRYTMTGEQPNLSGVEKGIMAIILMTLRQDEEQAADLSRKRAEAGAIGGKQKVAKQAIAYSQNKEEEVKAPEVQKKTVQRFSPPTVEDVQAYCRERGNKVDAERFCDFYASKGWKVGSQPMKDWKAAVRTWEREDKQRAAPVTQVSKKPAVQDYEQRDYTDREKQLMQNFIKMGEE